MKKIKQMLVSFGMAMTMMLNLSAVSYAVQLSQLPLSLMIGQTAPVSMEQSQYSLHLSQAQVKHTEAIAQLLSLPQQTEKLEDMVKLDHVVYISAPDEVMLERLTARESCPKCGATYNKLFLPAKVAGVCDKCGEALTQRKDDTVEAGKARIATFHEQSEPLVDFYKKKGILFEVDGTQAIDEITKAIIAGLDK